MDNILSLSERIPAGTYMARVAAWNDLGVSAPSAIITFRVGARAVPSRPVGFSASLQNSVAVLSWMAPAGDDADSPTGYVLEAGSASGLSDLARMPLGRTSYQAALPEGTYYLRVRATNALGIGEPSAEVVLRNGDGPGTPTNLADIGTGSLVQLTWQAPTTGELAGSYIIEAGSAPGLADLATMRVGQATTFTTTITQGVYYVRVRAVAANGIAGDASNEVIVRR
jgi:predicted phage tail protein